jgi:transcriptional regulator with XRE-family HTH domain
MISQRELGQRSGVHYVTISRIEGRGARANYATVRRLAEALGVKPEELL